MEEKPKIDEFHAIHRLMYHALIEMRMCGHESGDKVVWGLANLFHNVPAELERAAKGESSYADILAYIKSEASRTGCDRWVTERLRDIERRQGS